MTLRAAAYAHANRGERLRIMQEEPSSRRVGTLLFTRNGFASIIHEYRLIGDDA